MRRATRAVLVLLPVLSAPALLAAPLDFFPANDPDTILRLEFTNNVEDQSGQNNHPNPYNLDFVSGAFGRALRIPEPADPTTTAVGFDWSAHASLLVPPFTVEILLTDFNAVGYRKLLGYHDGTDAGWYFYSDGFLSFPEDEPIVGIPEGTLYYLALVVAPGDPPTVDVWIDADFAGSTATFDMPPAGAIFFRDDTTGIISRGEQFDGTVDALRISDRARTPEEITATYLASRVVFRDDFESGCPPPWSDFQGLVCFE